MPRSLPATVVPERPAPTVSAATGVSTGAIPRLPRERASATPVRLPGRSGRGAVEERVRSSRRPSNADKGGTRSRNRRTPAGRLRSGGPRSPAAPDVVQDVAEPGALARRVGTADRLHDDPRGLSPPEHLDDPVPLGEVPGRLDLIEPVAPARDDLLGAVFLQQGPLLGDGLLVILADLQPPEELLPVLLGGDRVGALRRLDEPDRLGDGCPCSAYQSRSR